MLNLVCFILFVVGVFLFINSFSKLGSILNSMDDRFYGYVVDKDLQKKIKIVDYLRCLKHLFAMAIGFFMMTTTIVSAFNVTLNLTPISWGIIVFYFINELVIFVVRKKYKLDDLYDDIKRQWEKEKKVSERHDEEVSFIKGVDDINNVFFQSVCWLITVCMWIMVVF